MRIDNDIPGLTFGVGTVSPICNHGGGKTVMPIILISLPVDHPELVPAQCSLCKTTVNEHQANLDRLGPQDYVICVTCAIELKIEMPTLFPPIEAQLWKGHVREPQPTPQNKLILEFLNRKV